MNILLNFVGPLRVVCITIDHVLYSLLGKVYSIVIGFSSAELLNHDTIKQMSNNLYVLIGVIAFFRLAVVLVNAIIDPDKLNEKGKGISNIFFRVVGMIILLVVTPFLFQKSYELQSKIVKNNLVFKVILGDKAGNLENNPGQALKSITISSLITVDKNFATFDAKSGYTPTEKCTRSCEDAVEEYNKEYKKGKFNLTKLSKYIDGSKKIDGQEIYYYDYMMILTGIVGIFMTWIIISFGIDIAVRMFELITLELLSPLFIATFVDPKSAQSGPFKNWLSAVGNSYLSLYIRLAILALMLLLISAIKESTIFDSFGTSSGFAKIFMVIGLLIFAKKAPKWISDMIGLKGDGTGLWSPKKMRENMFGGKAIAGAIAGATAGATALGLAGAKRLGSIHRDNKERRKDLTGHSSILGSKRALSKDKKEIGRLEDRLNNPNLSKEERNETQKTLAERKEAYEKNKNALKDISGGKAVANQLRNAAGDGIVNAVGDFKAGVKAGSITGAVKVASDRNAVYKEENALRGQTISEKVGEWAQNRVKKSSQLAFGSRNDRDEMQEQQKKIQKASDWTGLGDFGKQGVGLGKGNIVVGQKDANVVCESLKNADFSVNSKNFAAAQYALNRGYASLDENGKIDLSGMKFDASSNSFEFNGEDKISAEKLEKNCGGIMDSSSAAMVNQEKMVNTYLNNALNTYQQNEQARAQELASYQTAKSQSKAIGDAINKSIEKAMKNSTIKLDTSSLKSLTKSCKTELSKITDEIDKIGNNPDDGERKQELEEMKSTLEYIKQNAELKQAFDNSASTSAKSIKKLVAQNQELYKSLDSIKGDTIAEKQNNLSIESKNISDKEQRLTEDKKSKKGE